MLTGLPSRMSIVRLVLSAALSYYLWVIHVDGISVPPVSFVDPGLIAEALYYYSIIGSILFFIASSSYTYALPVVGSMWAALDVMLWFNPRIPLITLAISTIVYLVTNLAGSIKLKEDSSTLKTLLQSLALPGLALALSYSIYRAVLAIPDIAVSAGVLVGDQGLVSAIISETRIWIIASAVTALFISSIIVVWLFKMLLILIGGGSIRSTVASLEIRSEKEAELSGKLEGLLSYIYVALLSVILLPALRSMSELILSPITKVLVTPFDYLVLATPILVILYILRRGVLTLMRGNTHSLLAPTLVFTAIALALSLIISPYYVVEALSGVPAPTPDPLAWIASPDYGEQVEAQLYNFSKILPLIVRLFWGG